MGSSRTNVDTACRKMSEKKDKECDKQTSLASRMNNGRNQHAHVRKAIGGQYNA